MARTFEQFWREVGLHCPLASPFLLRRWVQLAYNALCDQRHWAWLRYSGQLLTDVQRSGTCTVTRNSTAVVAGTLTFVATDVGRQFRVSGLPYTIAAVAGGDATLDRVYSGTSGSVTGSVLDAFLTMPADHGAFVVIWDPAVPCQLNPYWDAEKITAYDPQRITTGDPVALAAIDQDSQGRPRYELWPYPTTAKEIKYLAIRRPAELGDDDTFKPPLDQRTDILVEGALWKAAEWPGTADVPNPYYKPELARRKQEYFELQAAMLERVDENIFSSWLEQVSLITRLPFREFDSSYRRAHAYPAVPPLS